MASPPDPSHQTSGNTSDYYYFVLAVAVVAILLLLSNTIAVGCCSRCGIIEALRRFLRFRRLSASASAGEIDDKNIPEQVIPACKYRREEAREHECSVCLSVFVEGEDIRQLPKCKHSFHAPCIDMWLYSHSNCPLCRADVLERPPPRCQAFAGDDVGEASMQRRPIEPRGMGGLVVALM